MPPPPSLRPTPPRSRAPRPSSARTSRVRIFQRLASFAILAWLLSSKRMMQRYAAFSSSLVAPDLREARSVLWVTAHREFWAPLAG